MCLWGKNNYFLRDFKEEVIGLTSDEASNLRSKLAWMSLELDEMANQLSGILFTEKLDSRE